MHTSILNLIHTTGLAKMLLPAGLLNRLHQRAMESKEKVKDCKAELKSKETTGIKKVFLTLKMVYYKNTTVFPFFIILLTIAQLMVYGIYAKKYSHREPWGPHTPRTDRTLWAYRPDSKPEVWRFLSYVRTSVCICSIYIRNNSNIYCL